MTALGQQVKPIVADGGQIAAVATAWPGATHFGNRIGHENRR